MLPVIAFLFLSSITACAWQMTTGNYIAAGLFAISAAITLHAAIE